MLVKVNAVADRTHEGKYEVKQPAVDVSQGKLKVMQKYSEA
jgi:hypothetical protein